MFKRVMPLMAVVLVFSVTTQAESRFPGGLALKVVSGARAGLDEVIKTGSGDVSEQTWDTQGVDRAIYGTGRKA